MPRNRVIYQSQAVSVTSDIVSFDADAITNGSISGLQRIQSANYSFNVSRQDVNQFGDLAAIDRIIVDSPTVSFDTSYYLANFTNERSLGFYVTPSGDTTFKSCVTDIISTGATDGVHLGNNQKNYFITTTKEGTDANDDFTTGNYESVIGIGNGFLTSYSSEASVGGLPTVSVSVEGQNMNFVNAPYLGKGANGADTLTSHTANGFVTGVGEEGPNTLLAISGESPAVDATNGVKVGKFVNIPVSSGMGGTGITAISSLRPGDVTLSLTPKTSDAIVDIENSEGVVSPDYAGMSISDAHIQSYTLSFDLSRTPIQQLGNRFAFARAVDFPVTCSLGIEAVLSDLTTGSLADIIDCDKEYDAQIKLRDPVCIPGASDAGVKPVVCSYFVKGLKIDSQSFTASIGDNKSVSLSMTSQIGGPEQSGHGVFMSGFYNTQQTISAHG